MNFLVDNIYIINLLHLLIKMYKRVEIYYRIFYFFILKNMNEK